MKTVFDNIIDVVGFSSTPLVRLHTIAKGLAGVILGKMESMNPLGSVKDRIGVAMIQAGEAQGLITPDTKVFLKKPELIYKGRE